MEIQSCWRLSTMEVPGKKVGTKINSKKQWLKTSNSWWQILISIFKMKEPQTAWTHLVETLRGKVKKHQKKPANCVKKSPVRRRAHWSSGTLELEHRTRVRACGHTCWRQLLWGIRVIGGNSETKRESWEYCYWTHFSGNTGCCLHWQEVMYNDSNQTDACMNTEHWY